MGRKTHTIETIFQTVEYQGDIISGSWHSRSVEPSLESVLRDMTHVLNLKVHENLLS